MDPSSEPSCSRDQEQPCPDGDGPGGSPDALTGWCETFDIHGCRYDGHRPQIHDPDDEGDRRQAGTAVAAVEAEAQAVSPGRGCPHICSGIRIHASDIVQAPGFGISPIADMDAHQTIVTAALAAKSSA